MSQETDKSALSEIEAASGETEVKPAALTSEDEIRALSTIANQAAVAIEHTRLLDEAVATRKALETRKLVERAKGILMEDNRLTEAQAFRMLQQQSMQRRKSMQQVAEAVVLARELRVRAQ